MKKFLIYVGLFFSLIFIIDLVFGVGARYLNSHAKGGDTYNHYYITEKMADSVVVFGSSRAIHHFNPKIIEDSLGMTAYNCGVDGNGIIFNYGRLLDITRRYKPSIIIYDVIPSFDMEEDDYSKYLQWLRRWYDHPGIPEIFPDVDSMEKYKMLSNLYRYNRFFLQMLSDNIKPRQELAYKGYKPIYETMTVETDRTDHSKPAQWSELKLNYFQRFVNLCQKNNIKLVISFSPWYRAGSSKIYDEFRSFAQKNELEILDFYTDTEITTNPALFADVSHLNNSGADKFTAKFMSALKKLQIVKPI